MASKKKKKRSKKNKSGRRKSRRTGSVRRGSLGRFLGGLTLFILLFGGLIFTAFMHGLDKQVRNAFDSERWALPAHIYARPLELYGGRTINVDSLVAELTGLGYRRVNAVGAAGTFRSDASRVTIATRGFDFADGEEPAQTLDVRFTTNESGQQQVAELTSNIGGELAIARLEPRPLGSVSNGAHEDRDLLRLKQVPDALIDILLLTEDRSFFEHHGIAPKAVLRAMFANLRAGGVVQGGSTITQQLIKNILLTPERSWSRKIKEALMAIVLDWRYSKEQILEAYVNEVYLGQSGNRAIHGFGLASQFYFDRPLMELDLHEMALLVGMVRGPSYYSPRRHPERAFNRRNRVLNSVGELAGLEPEVITRYREKDLGVTAKGAGRSGHPAFREYVQRHLRTQYDPDALQADGLDVFTTLDPLIQATTERALAQGLAQIEKDNEIAAGVLEGAVVVVSVDNGEVLAAVGGRKAGFEGFNRALDARRPIGSLIKPAVFLSALMKPERYNLVSLIEDEPFTVEGPGDQVWEPGNYSGEPHGVVTLIDTLARSYNLATARLGLEVGLESVVETLERLGIGGEIPRYPSLLLGSLDLAPIEVAQMYQIIANGGFMAPLKTVSNVMTADGQSLRRNSSGLHQTLPVAPVYLLTEAMQQVMRTGTGRTVAGQFDSALGLAGKTGTTDDFRDSWFAGFSGNYVAVVWVGRDDNEPTGLSGARGALRIFGRVMSDLGLSAVNRPLPADIEQIGIDPASGLLADENCDVIQTLPFISGSEPRGWAPCSRTVAFDSGSERRTRNADGVRGWIDRLLGGSGDRTRQRPQTSGSNTGSAGRDNGAGDAVSRPRSLDDSNR